MLAKSTAIAALTTGLLCLAGGALAEEAKIIKLTQTGCQFVEPENGKDRGFAPTAAEDCKKINESTGEDRLAEAQALRLQPGKYIFRVKNENVPYQLGFWLRGQGLSRVTLPSVSGGGLGKGQTRDYEIELKPGTYAYSCPLNPTPDYTLVVEN